MLDPSDPIAAAQRYTPIMVSVGDRVFLGKIEKLHLPGKHDQRSHGNKVGKKDLVQTKTGIGRYAYLQRKGTGNAHVGDVILVVDSDKHQVAKALRNREATVTGWVNENRAQLEFSDGEITDVHKDFLKVVRTSQELADDAKGGDRAGNAKKILNDKYGNRFHLIGKETERTRAFLNDLAKVPESHHKAVAAHLKGTPTGGIYLGHAPVVDLAPGMDVWRNEQPRGYAKGDTYGEVGGVYIPTSREVAIGVSPHGSGSHSTATHEFGHALDDTLTADQRSEWKDLYNKLDRAIFMNPYFHPLQNTSGYHSESFAEVYAVWSTGGSVRDAIRSLGDTRVKTPEGQETADAAVAEAFKFFEGIKA